MFLYALASLVCLGAWGALVWTAVGAGGDARDGHSGAWVKLVIAAVIAMAFLFLAFIAIGRLWRELTTEPPGPTAPRDNGAYVEEQGYYDDPSGYGQQGYDQQPYGQQPYDQQGFDTGSYAYNPYDTGTQDAYDTGQDLYGTASPDPYGASTGPTYGIGGNQLPRRSSASFEQPSYERPGYERPGYEQPSYPQPPSTPPAQPPSSGQGYGGYASNPTGSYDPSSYRGRSNELGSGTAAYGTGRHPAAGGYPRTPRSEPAPPTSGPPAPSMPTGRHQTDRTAPRLPSQRPAAEEPWPPDESPWPPEPPRGRH